MQVTLLILGIFCSSTWASAEERQGPGPEVEVCRSALQQCVQPIISRFQHMSSEQVLELLRTVDLRHTCSAVLSVRQCVASTLATPECEAVGSSHPAFIHARRQIQMMGQAVQFICVENVDVFNQHKECLLRSGRYGLALMDEIGEQCRQAVNDAVPIPGQGHCPAPEVLSCALGVVSEQCGEEIAGYVRTLGSRVLTAMGCSGNKRFKMTKKQMFSPLEMLQESLSSLF